MTPRGRVILSLSSAAVGMYGPTFLAFVGGSSSDHITSLFVLAGLCVLIRGIRVHGSPDMPKCRFALVTGAVLIGMAAGLKLICAIFLIGYGAAVIAAGRGVRSRMAATGLSGVAGVLGVLITRGYWMAFLWTRFGSPLFPFYNRIFKSPYYYDANFSDDRYLPKTLIDGLLLPFHFIADGQYSRLFNNFRDIRYAIVYEFILLCIILFVVRYIIVRRRSFSTIRTPDRTELFLLVFFVVSYVIWQTKFAIIRYALPLELLAPMVIAVLCRYILPWDDLRMVLTGLAFAAIVLIMRPCNIPHQDWGPRYFNVEPPKLEYPDETLIIMASDQPRSYVIPAFDPGVRFIGLASSFNHPESGDQHRAADEMLDLVRTHTGPVYLLSNSQEVDRAFARIRPYGIAKASERSLPVRTKHDLTDLSLWPVEIKGGQ
jgi:hypothetical protein